MSRQAFWQDVRAGSVAMTGEDSMVIRLMNIIFDATRSGRLPVAQFSALERKIKRMPLKPQEEFYTIRQKTVAGSARKSFLEVAVRCGAVMEDREIIFASGYLMAKRDTVLICSRTYPLTVTPHAACRFIERAGASKRADANTSTLIDGVTNQIGLFILLSHVAGGWEGSNLSVPFHQGMMLCESMPTDEPFICRLNKGDRMLANPTLEKTARPHRLLWVGEGRGPGVIQARTYVGRNELKPGQIALHDLITGIHREYREEIDLLGQLCGVFHADQMPEVEEKLEQAIPRLDDAVMRIAYALRDDSSLAYSFSKESYFHPSSVRLPSQAMEEERADRMKVKQGLEELGVVNPYGPYAIHVEYLSAPSLLGAAYHSPDYTSAFSNQVEARAHQNTGHSKLGAR